MKFRVTKEDFLKGGLAELGWHPSRIKVWDDTKVSGANAKNPGSQYTEAQFEIVAGPSKGKVIYSNFSEITPVFMVPLLEGITGQTVDKNKDFEFEVSRASMEGKLVDIHLIASSYNNKPKREIDGYRKYTGPVATAAATAGV